MSNTARNKELVDALELVMRAVNGGGSDNERAAAVQDWFAREHRTLQQSFMRIVIMPLLLQLDQAYTNGRTDLRNQDAAEMAHKMLQAVEERDRYLPLV